MLVIGTRPDAIKMYPLVKELKGRGNIRAVVCSSGQHREMLRTVTDSLDVALDYDLSVMREGSSLADLTSMILEGIDRLLDKITPDLVLVHGDTTTAFATALACFYRHIPLGHVEAGLRTYDVERPYPEELNRRFISLVAKYNFAPTELARANLLREGVPEECIHLTGNTVIDTLAITLRDDYTHPEIEWARDSRLLLVTAHRRESIGAPMRAMLRAIRRALDEIPDVKAIYPIHMNPEVRMIAEAELSGCDRIHLIEPLDVVDFHNLLARAYIVLTDSGGIQEEATALGRPTLVMRDTTERPEGVASGTLMLVGREEQGVYERLHRLLDDRDLYERMSIPSNAYGDGHACRRIADVIEGG